MRFCGKCGAVLEKTCHNCDFSNPSEFEFCGKCAHDLSISVEQPRKALSFDEKIAKIQRYLPEGLTEDEVRAMVREIVAGGATAMGAVMGQLMPKIRGRFDGKEANRVVKEELDG